MVACPGLANAGRQERGTPSHHPLVTRAIGSGLARRASSAPPTISVQSKFQKTLLTAGHAVTWCPCLRCSAPWQAFGAPETRVSVRRAVLAACLPFAEGLRDLEALTSIKITAGSSEWGEWDAAVDSFFVVPGGSLEGLGLPNGSKLVSQRPERSD